MKTLLLLILLTTLIASCKTEQTHTVTPTDTKDDPTESVEVRSINIGQVSLDDGSLLSLPTDKDIFICVRHAEKDTSVSNNPSLTRAGIDRTDRLSVVLADAGLTAVYSTPFKRTLLTAASTAASKGMSVKPYRPEAMSRVISEARDDSAINRILVVGHSNTTTALVNQIAGDQRLEESIPEDDYGRIYVVVDSRPVVVHQLRY